MIILDDLARQAYNGWGGISSYNDKNWLGESRPGQIVTSKGDNTVSFDRPSFGNDEYHSGWPGFVFFGTFNFIKYIEEQGRDVTYASDVDLARSPGIAENHKAILFVGHSEYWTEEMWVTIVTARDNGVHLGFFSSNICYWICSYDETSGRHFFCKKYGPPGGGGLWRSKLTHNRESILIGVDFHDANDVGPTGAVGGAKLGLTITNCDHWICSNTGCSNGDVVPLVVDYEVDRRSPQSPPQTEVIGNCHLSGDVVCEMTVYEHGSAIVFATGSMYWSHVLSLDGDHSLGICPVPLARAMTKNVLDKFENT